MTRCYNPHAERYAKYGGRGIKVCPEWHDFKNFLKDMGVRPEGMTLDRENVDGDYEKGNCKWATAKEQSRNKQNTAYLTVNGVTKLMLEWSEETGIPYSRLHKRVTALGWTPEQAVEKKRPYKRKGSPE